MVIILHLEAKIEKEEPFFESSDMTDEEEDKPVQQPKKKSLRQRLANWLDKKVKKHHEKKIARTDLKEGHLTHSSESF